MFETLGFEILTPKGASLYLGLALGLVFGILAEITRFCIRRAISGESAGERRSAAGVWAAALAAAILGTQWVVQAGWVDFSEHRFLSDSLPVVALVAGGLMFGAGMILTRGCASRLAVLTGTGNLRGLLVLLIFAITAHATLKGVLAPVRTTLGSVTVDLGGVTGLAALPGGGLFWSVLLALGAGAIAATSRAKPLHLVLAVLIGLLVPLGWAGTGFVLFDEFDPIVLESLSLTSPASETLFWTVASTSIAGGFGVGLVGGIVLGAAVSALIGGRFRWQSFESPAQTGRYAGGAVLMGVGGVLAGGCTLGAGLSGLPTLSFAALLGFGAILLGGVLTEMVLRAAPRGARMVPAE